MWHGRYSFHFKRRYLCRRASSSEVSRSYFLFPCDTNRNQQYTFSSSKKCLFFTKVLPSAEQKIGSAVSAGCNVSNAETCIVILLRVASCFHVSLHSRLNLEPLQPMLWPFGFCSVHPVLSFRCSDFTCLLRQQDHYIYCRLCPKPRGIRAKFWRVWNMITLYFISWSQRLGILSWSRYSCGLAIGQEGIQRVLLV